MTRDRPRDRDLIVGGAGFIGSHFTDALLGRPATRAGDALRQLLLRAASGTTPTTRSDARLQVVRGDVDDLRALTEAMAGHDARHPPRLATPTSPRAMTDPTIDFDEGTLLTHNVVEAMRQTRRAARSSTPPGSGVYGDLGEHEAAEDHGPLRPGLDLRRQQAGRRGADRAPTRTCSGLRGRAFRFGNVVGPRQTHGVGFDFVRRLLEDPSTAAHPRRRQAEQVLHPRRATSCARCCCAVDAAGHAPFDAFNVATGDYITVREIAELAVRGGSAPRPRCATSTPAATAAGRATSPSCGSRPSASARLGWEPSMGSRGALEESMRLMLADLAGGGRSVSAPAVFLDRDGVLNAAGRPSTAARTRPPDVAELAVLPGRRPGLPPPRRGRPAADRRHQPARHRPRHARRRAAVEAINDRAARAARADRRDRLPARRRGRLRLPQAAARHAARRRRRVGHRPRRAA